jgi:hypothetical protein
MKLKVYGGALAVLSLALLSLALALPEPQFPTCGGPTGEACTCAKRVDAIQELANRRCHDNGGTDEQCQADPEQWFCNILIPDALAHQNGMGMWYDYEPYKLPAEYAEMGGLCTRKCYWRDCRCGGDKPGAGGSTCHCGHSLFNHDKLTKGK